MSLGGKRGELPPVLPSTEGYRILKVISKEPAGQRELTDPRVQQTIRETLTNRKDQLLKAAYYEVARNEAKVTNYLAKQIMDNAAKKYRHSHFLTKPLRSSLYFPYTHSCGRASCPV